ncbi:MAG: superoxide dismutase [Muribaculaceae bacterium]|nr:superoxide dismutase [Muribaculaceae bacterium]
MVTQPSLPYSPDALAPFISERTVSIHFGKHTKAYFDTTNQLIKGTEYEDMPLDEIVVKSDGILFNNASQAWNHIFYFFTFDPEGLHEPEGALKRKIEETFESVDNLKETMKEAGKTLFGSGWVWLSADADGKLIITQGRNAESPLKDGLTPLLCIDVWEHAYYLDYENRRPDYIDAQWNIIDWKIAGQRYDNIFEDL